MPLEAGKEKQLHPFEDLWVSPMSLEHQQLEAFDEYLQWETSLRPYGENMDKLWGPT
ncbi:hypothetical protein D3C86_1821250 [compost metagenome]